MIYIYISSLSHARPAMAWRPPPRVMVLATPASLAFHSAQVPFAATDRSIPPFSRSLVCTAGRWILVGVSYERGTPVKHSV